MSYTPTNPLDRTSLILGLISQKQKMLGANLANIDTPGYIRKDIDFQQYLGNMNSPLETDLSTRLGPSAVITEDGKQVVPVDELSSMQKNALYYNVAVRRMSSIITQMKTVVNVGK